MLRTLVIENIAVIQRADISFDAGFHVLSGETGAGKSIIIDSLNAILGARVSRELIRTGETRSSVTASFDGLPQKALDCAAGLGIDMSDGTLLLSREIYADGRNACRVNGAPATLSILKALGETLVNIHGQHDGQHLLNEQLHIEYLDSFGRIGEALADYQKQYESLLSLNRKIKGVSMGEKEKKAMIARLTARVKELEEASVLPGEQAELNAQRRQLMSGERLTQALGQALAFVDGNGEEEGAASLMDQAERSIRDNMGGSAQLEGFAQRLEELGQGIRQISSDMAALFAEQDYSPDALEQAEERLDQIQRLCDKYHVEADGLEGLLDATREELGELEDTGSGLEALKEQYTALRARVADAAGVLHKRRVKAAKEMTKLIEDRLHHLDMPAARFHVEIESTLGESQARFTKRGTDTVRFLLSANSGEDLKALTKVASGGELSRIMLAMKTILSKGEENVTAVFDEIDTGVSGRAASHVGQQLYEISTGRQVLCVTHLPQIACLADTQYYITKFDREGRTYTQVERLETEGRIRELARLTAGVHITDAALENAGEMLRQAEEWKKKEG